MRRVWLLLAGCAALSGAQRAAAAPLVLDWQAPACAREVAFRTRVRDALRREPESALERELRVRISISENAEKNGYSLQILTDSGARQLDLPSCDEAVAAAATVVALSIDPNAQVPEPSSEASVTEPEVEPAPPPTPSQPAPPSGPEAPEPVAPAPRLEAYIAAFGGVSLGDVPSLSPLVGGGVGLRLRSFGVAAEGFWVASQRELLAGTSKGGDIGLWGAGLSVCYVQRPNDLLLSACLGGQGGSWRSGGVGVQEPTEQSDWWLAGLGRVQAGASLASSLGLFLSADVVVPARRPSFKLAGLGEVFRPSAVAGRFSGGAELRF